MNVIQNDEMILGTSLDVHDEIKKSLIQRLKDEDDADEYRMVAKWLGLLAELYEMDAETIVKVTWDYDGDPILTKYKEEK